MKARRWKRNAAIAGIFSAIVSGYAMVTKFLEPPSKAKRPQPAQIAPAVAQPVPAPQPIAAQTPKPNPQAAMPTPALAPKSAHRVAEQPVLAPSPSAATVKPKPETKHISFTTPPVKKTVTEVAKKEMKRTRRNPASSKTLGPRSSAPTTDGYAYITVISTPETKIIVNGRYVGKELTNEIKIPAGRPVTVKTINEMGATRSKSFNFKPATHNVIEMFE